MEITFISMITDSLLYDLLGKKSTTNLSIVEFGFVEHGEWASTVVRVVVACRHRSVCRSFGAQETTMSRWDSASGR